MTLINRINHPLWFPFRGPLGSLPSFPTYRTSKCFPLATGVRARPRQTGIIAGAVGAWFFTEKASKGWKSVMCPAVVNAIFWPLVSMRLGVKGPLDGWSSRSATGFP